MKKIWANMQIAIKTTPKITTNSGFTLKPWVSSSKNLSKPALAAGIGDPSLRRFFRLLTVTRPNLFTAVKIN